MPYLVIASTFFLTLYSPNPRRVIPTPQEAFIVEPLLFCFSHV